MKTKWFKNIALGLLILFLAIQFYRPERNLGNDVTADITHKFAVPDSVQTILKASCYDCHSNQTVYPWYTNIQPVGWWLQSHINDGKRGLNFSAFSSYSVAKQYKRMADIKELVEKHEMPLPSYTLIHTYAKLDANQQALLINWTNIVRDSIKANNPPDSLIMPKRPKRN